MNDADYTTRDAPALPPVLPGAAAWAGVIAAAGIVTGVLYLFDSPISSAARGVRLGGDVTKELTALQQYGQFSLSLACAAAIALLDRARWRRLLDWLLAAVVTEAVVYLLASIIGRARPGVTIPEARSFFGGYDLLSMPSRHAALAGVMSAFLCVMYPRLLPLAAVMAVIVCAARVLNGAHYPSDTAAGLTIGVLISLVCARKLLGVRLLDWVWVRLVDRDARPAWPSLVDRC